MRVSPIIKKTIISVIINEDVEKLEPSCIAGGNVKQYNPFRKKFDGFLKS